MTRTVEKAILGLLMVFVLGIGSVLVSAAVTNKNPMDFISSLRVAGQGEDNALEVPEAEESAQLAPLARITAGQAKAIALNEVTGTLSQVELDNEDGNVVYSVEITNNKDSFDVKIDAGNGKVLKVESGTEEDPVEKEGPETESKDSDFEQDGINHQFEGGEGDHED